MPAETLNRGKRLHEVLAVWWGDDEGRGTAEASLPPVERAMMRGYFAFYNGFHGSGLRDIRVKVPFRVTIGGVEFVGEVDAVGWEVNAPLGFEYDRQLVVVEHKSTTSDITPGSQWWREKVHVDPQASTYSYAFPGAKILFDVLHVPTLRQFGVTKTRKEPETDAEYIDRCLADMAEQPSKYFQRAYVVRLESEREAFAEDVANVEWLMQYPARENPRNPRACFTYGRECEFFAACWQGKPIEEYPQVERNHSEEVLEKWEKSR